MFSLASEPGGSLFQIIKLHETMRVAKHHRFCFSQTVCLLICLDIYSRVHDLEFKDTERLGHRSEASTCGYVMHRVVIIESRDYREHAWLRFYPLLFIKVMLPHFQRLLVRDFTPICFSRNSYILGTRYTYLN